MRCDDAAAVLLDMVDSPGGSSGTGGSSGPGGTSVPEGPRRAHVEHCLRCQAELAQHRRIRRSLASLRAVMVEPDPSLVAEVIESLSGAAIVGAPRAGLGRHRAAYVAAATAATAAGAAGAVLLASRSRRTKLSPTG